jgi:hypothetical protein
MNEAVSIGTHAANIVDAWAWWRSALANPAEVGKSLPVHDGEPHIGYYRVRRKGAPWEPVAIFIPDDSEQMVAYRNNREVQDINALWIWCCRNPIEYEAYQKAVDTGVWDDEPVAAPGIGDNSGEADPFDALNIEYLGEKELAEEFMRSKVTTQAQADKVAIWAKRLTAIKSKAEGLHKVEKQPHLDAGRAVDDKWRDLKSEPDELAKKLKAHIKPFLQEQIRQEEERQRKAREEADAARRAAQEAAKKAAESDQQSEQDRAAAIAEADRQAAIARDAEQEAEARKVNAGRTGARVSMRIEKVGFVTDYAKAAAALVAMRHPDMIAEIDRLAKAAAKKSFPFDGMEIREEERVV